MKMINNNWLSRFSKGQPLMIAGPCSAETQNQMLTIAHQVKKSGVEIFRAGVWKPRTRPNTFEGVGEEGLGWLNDVKRETGMLTATEIATSGHAELALKHDIDVLWIGARSTVSPFVVQEIADAIRGTDKIVLVKNPVSPDLALWTGAFERLQQANVTNLGAIHRGFTTYGSSVYRNQPNWPLALDFKNQMPEIPLICDPSHIAGVRDFVAPLAKEAIELGYHGLMVETHHTPDSAWSDAKQQITPETLSVLMTELVDLYQSVDHACPNKALQKLRYKVDIFDQQLIGTLALRMKTTNDIGMLKKQHGIEILKANRWDEVLNRMLILAKENGLPESFIESTFNMIHEESLKQQQSLHS